MSIGFKCQGPKVELRFCSVLGCIHFSKVCTISFERPVNYLCDAVGKSFSFEPVAYTSVLKLLQQLNPYKSAGIDNLTGKFLKEGAPVLASPITNLINLSISLSSFPDDCKIAKLKPLYKKEAKTKPENYRPISLLPLI